MEVNGGTLASLEKGQTGVITAVNATDPQIQRLMTLGLVEGVEVEHATTAIGGDPLELRLFGKSISLRLEQARQFKISPVEGVGN